MNDQSADAIFANCPLIGTCFRVRRALDLQGNEISLADRRFGAFCAIARPQRFLETLKNAGVQVVDHWFLADHDKFDPVLLQRFADRCRKMGAQGIICTEKDAVKLPRDLAVYYLEMELEIVSGQSDWHNLIEKIALNMNN